MSQVLVCTSYCGLGGIGWRRNCPVGLKCRTAMFALHGFRPYRLSTEGTLTIVAVLPGLNRDLLATFGKQHDDQRDDGHEER